MRSSATAARSSLVLSRPVAASVIDAKSALTASMLTPPGICIHYIPRRGGEPMARCGRSRVSAHPASGSFLLTAG
jgi:hypothetical protein